MILPFAHCILAKSVFALGLFSVQQLGWFLCGTKLSIFLSELRILYPFPWSLSSSHMSTFWSQDSPAYVGAPYLLCFASAVASCSRRLCQVRCACFSFPFQESSSGLLCSLWEEASQRPSSAPAITFLKGLHLTQCTAGKTGMLCGSSTENTYFRNGRIYCYKFTSTFCRRNSL